MSAVAVSARGLSVGYERRAVVEGVDLEIRPGAELAVVGTNGSGKSTLVRTIAGLVPAVAGELEVLGDEPGASPARVAYLAQSHPQGFVLPLRVADVVAMGRFARRGLLGRMRAEDRDAVAYGLERMGIAGLADRPLATLSGGQRQRAYLAQVLAWQADLIILDEPTSGLDLAGVDLLEQATRIERGRGAAVVVCTHDIRDALEADHALLLAGRVVASGAPATVLTREALLETFGLVVAQLPGGTELTMDPSHRHDHDH
ncbi:MAG: metal ABC transporter ATP-binding protein [Thermoleophilia bacterium]|jgi:ABC-type Mn2+/Zn2+ transport system ATPase subunit